MKKNTLKRFRRKSKNGGKKRISNKNKRLVRKTQKIRGGKGIIGELVKKVARLFGSVVIHNNGVYLEGDSEEVKIEKLITQSNIPGTQQQIEREELFQLLRRTKTFEELPKNSKSIDSSVLDFYYTTSTTEASFTSDNEIYTRKWACAELLYDQQTHEQKSTLPLHENTRFYSFALSPNNLSAITSLHQEITSLHQELYKQILVQNSNSEFYKKFTEEKIKKQQVIEQKIREKKEKEDKLKQLIDGGSESDNIEILQLTSDINLLKKTINILEKKLEMYVINQEMYYQEHASTPHKLLFEKGPTIEERGTRKNRFDPLDPIPE